MTHGAELRAFHAAAQAGSISAGARRLGLTQPTVSAHITKLEKDFEVELFFRRGRRVELTEFGMKLLESTRRLVDAEIEATSLLMHARNASAGHLRVCAVGPYNSTPLIREFHRAWPDVRISMSVGDSQQILQRILEYSGEVGLLVHSVDDPRIECTPYRRQPLVFFTHADHPLARRARLAIHDLEGQLMVMREVGSTTRRVVEQVLAREGVRVRCQLEIGSREAVREAVAQGLGVGIVSETAYLADSRLARLPIRCDGLATHAHVVCLKERRQARLITQFMAIVERMRDRLAGA